MPKPDAVTSAHIEEYLETIYRLGVDGGLASTSAVAEQLGVTPASVTGMVKRMGELGWLRHERYRGVRLTRKGDLAARALIRRHRLSERLLTDLLGFGWESAHDQACKLEHLLHGEFEERAVAALGDPRTCPHGNPIEPATEEASTRLSGLDPGDTGRLLKITDERPEFLRYLGELGLRPGVEVRVTAKAPLGGPLTVSVADRECALSQEAASRLHVVQKTARRSRRRA
jgi:DtxR family Mn-dependent transcriptional regulator